MFEVKRVLVPIDFSPTSRTAMRHAVPLAAWYDAQVTALHALAPVTSLLPMSAYEPYFADPLPTTDLRSPVVDELWSWLKQEGANPARSDVIVEVDDAAQLILKESEAAEHTVVVMGTHGRRGFTHLMLGSVAEKVVRAAIRPVLTVPPAAPTDAGLPFRRVMCAVDFSPTSWAAAEVAVALTERSNGRLAFVHIFEWPAALDTLIEISPEIGQARRQREREAEHRLEQLARTSIGVDRRPLWILDHGKPYERIVAMAAEDGADLLIMGVHSRNIFERALLGSTTTQVVRRAHCPVLTLRDVSTTHASGWNVAAVAAPVVG